MRTGRPTTSPALQLLPVSVRCANAFVQEHHRHHRPVQGAKFALAVALSDRDVICGVAIIGHLVARHLDDGWTFEVTRLSTNNYCRTLHGRLRTTAMWVTPSASRSPNARSRPAIP
ncbi:MAG: XF1762 family protein [Pigmentiphaga sp.]|uniref:XF1762 family protein n=1 Tax=Pigmentiphaga sp. TaxID=1977564 RepID=UPI003B567941